MHGWRGRSSRSRERFADFTPSNVALDIDRHQLFDVDDGTGAVGGAVRGCRWLPDLKTKNVENSRSATRPCSRFWGDSAPHGAAPIRCDNSIVLIERRIAASGTWLLSLNRWHIEQEYGFSPVWVRSCGATWPFRANRLRKSTPQDQCRYIPQYHLGVRLVLLHRTSSKRSSSAAAWMSIFCPSRAQQQPSASSCPPTWTSRLQPSPAVRCVRARTAWTALEALGMEGGTHEEEGGCTCWGRPFTLIESSHR